MCVCVCVVCVCVCCVCFVCVLCVCCVCVCVQLRICWHMAFAPEHLPHTYLELRMVLLPIAGVLIRKHVMDVGVIVYDCNYRPSG